LLDRSAAIPIILIKNDHINTNALPRPAGACTAEELWLRAGAQGVGVCGSCFSVTGPANASVDFFSYAAQANSTYQLSASWEPSYRGPVTISLEPQRRAPALA